MTQSAKAEFEALETVHGALEPLDDDARSRVVKYIVSLLAIDERTVAPAEEPADDEAAEAAGDKATEGASTYSTFAELEAAAKPTTNMDRALVAGYWLQECQGSASFTAQAANKELAHLGHKIANITNAFDSLKAAKPQLILQLKKSGSSQQARKIYQVNHAGIKRVQEMISG